MTIDEMKDRIAMAEEIQRYTENRCETLERENAELKKEVEKMKCCENCIGTCNSDDMARFCKDNKYKLWEIKENE